MPHRVRRPQRRSILVAILMLFAAAQQVVASEPTDEKGAYAAHPPRIMYPGGPSGYRLPFEPGVEVRVSQGWMTKGSHSRKGLSDYAYDFALPMNTPVLAAAPGVVAFTRTGNTVCGGKKKTKFANVVTINHADGSATQYGHLTTVDVEVGQVVEAGQVVGHSGKTGRTGCQPHLHFARQYQGDLVTRSIPIYFKGYERQRLYAGYVVSTDRTCGGPLAATADAKAATDGFCGAWYAAEFAGPALFWRRSDAIEVDTKSGGPGGYWLDAPQPYAVRWDGRFEFAPWWYVFTIEATGGVRLRIDGVVVLDDWTDVEGKREIVVRQRMRAGVHLVEVEHFSTREKDHVSVEWSALLVDE